MAQVSKMARCKICNKELEGFRKGNQSHAGKHCREFEEQTGYSKHTNYNLIIAYFEPEEAPKWAREIMEALKDANKIPKNNKTVKEYSEGQ